MRLTDCFENRLLRRERPDAARSRRSLEVADAKISEAEKAFDYGLSDAAIILAYTATFHAARAVLFRDGILDSMRIERHETIYGLETKSTYKETEYNMRKAKEFLSSIKKSYQNQDLNDPLLLESATKQRILFISEMILCGQWLFLQPEKPRHDVVSFDRELRDTLSIISITHSERSPSDSVLGHDP